MKKKKETLEDVLAQKPWLYAYLNEECQKDRNVVKSVFQKDGAMLEYAPTSIKEDKELVLIAVANGEAFEFASEDLQSDKEVILSALEYDDCLLEDLDDEFLEDLDILYKAVDIYPENFEYFSEELQEDRDIALACVKIRGYVYFSLCKEFQKDREFIEEAIKNGVHLKEIYRELEFSKDLSSDRTLLELAIKHNGGNEIYCANKELSSDKKLIEYAIDNGLSSLTNICKECRNDKSMVKKIFDNMISLNHLKEAYENVFAISEELLTDDDFMLELITDNEYVFQAMYSNSFHTYCKRNIPVNTDIAFCQKAYQANPKTLKYMGNAMKKNIASSN